MNTRRDDTEAIARAAIARVDPTAMVRAALTVRDDTLTIDRGGEPPLVIELDAFDSILVLGAGKAGAAMVAGLESVLGARISGGAVAVKYGHLAPVSRVELIEAGHPVPDGQSVAAARRIAELAAAADERTLVLTVISGGGSALLTLPAGSAVGPGAPARAPLTLDAIQATTALLLGAGAPIESVNTVRKHLSAISGGQFCRIAAPARVVALILSDVIGDDLASIASGLAAPDPTTFADARDACQQFGILERLPAEVRDHLEAGVAGTVPETPKPGAPIFDAVDAVLLGTNAVAVAAAAAEARRRGFNTLVLTSHLTGEAREIAHLFSAIAADIAAGIGPVAVPACVLAGGETTVTLRGTGRGGRNQEMALAVQRDFAVHPGWFQGATFLSVGTDGTDGPTDAAGAWAESGTAVDLESLDAALANNDSYRWLDARSCLLRTGPTNTNVCDVQVLIVA